MKKLITTLKKIEDKKFIALLFEYRDYVAENRQEVKWENFIKFLKSKGACNANYNC